MMPAVLAKAVADGYYHHNYSKWSFEREYEDGGDQIVEYRIHLGYGIYLDCRISIDRVTDRSVNFKYTLTGSQWGKERVSNSFVIENISIFMNGREILMPHSSYLVTIVHEPFDVTSYIKENARSVTEKYRVEGEDIENEIRYRMPKFPSAEYAGLPAYEFDSAMISDGVMDKLLRTFEFGDVSALGKMTETDGTYEGCLNIVSGYRLKYSSEGESIYLDDLEYILDWSSPDGDYGISVTIDHLTSKDHAFRMYGHGSRFDLYIGCARLEYYFKTFHKNS